MGIKIGRIVKEFVFNSLIDQEIEIEIHGNKKDLLCKINTVEENVLSLEILRGEAEKFTEEEDIRIFFFFQNNYHTFDSVLLEKGEGILKIKHPEGVYKNPERKYERIKLLEQIQVSFILKGKKVELNFPKIESAYSVEEPESPENFDFSSVQDLINNFREKMSEHVSYTHITMLRNKIPESYEERVLAALGKILWIPSTEEDFPLEDPFPDQRVITKDELAKYEESFDLSAYIITSKLSNILYEKQKKNIFSEAFCPILYNEYLVGYIYCVNRSEKRERISPDLLDYIYQFSNVLTYSLNLSGYFSTESGEEQLFEAQIIDMSASGLLFAYAREDLDRELLIQTDLDLTLKLQGRKMQIGSRVRRKIKDNLRTYFGVQFLKIDPSDFHYIYETLYGRPCTPEEEDKWEGGAPPPPLNIFND